MSPTSYRTAPPRIIADKSCYTPSASVCQAEISHNGKTRGDMRGMARVRAVLWLRQTARTQMCDVDATLTSTGGIDASAVIVTAPTAGWVGVGQNFLANLP